jgi:hypothetical protein
LKLLMHRVVRAVNKPRITLEDTKQAFTAFGMKAPADRYRFRS